MGINIDMNSTAKGQIVLLEQKKKLLIFDVKKSNHRKTIKTCSQSSPHFKVFLDFNKNALYK